MTAGAPSACSQVRWIGNCERRAVEHDLRSAVENGELFVEYQPQVDHVRGIVGHEALVRWQHPVRGVIAPGEFIPVAEESGLIAKIDEWVLKEACRAAASWSTPLRIAVNISAAQFRRENLERQVKTALREADLRRPDWSWKSQRAY